jgi:hypothetical protein
MIQRLGIALTVIGAIIVIIAGSAHAWPRAGIGGHFSYGPALNRGPVAEQGGEIQSPVVLKEGKASSEYQSREPVETGNLPERVDPRSDDAKILGNGEKLDRHEIDLGP